MVFLRSYLDDWLFCSDLVKYYHIDFTVISLKKSVCENGLLDLKRVGF